MNTERTTRTYAIKHECGHDGEVTVDTREDFWRQADTVFQEMQLPCAACSAAAIQRAVKRVRELRAEYEANPEAEEAERRALAERYESGETGPAFTTSAAWMAFYAAQEEAEREAEARAQEEAEREK